jgi:predicted RNA polymerase sigma factor
MLQRRSKTMNPRAKLSKALRASHLDEALDIYELIEAQEPHEPRWPHRRGDLLRRMGRVMDAVHAYERAVDLYIAKGFEARAAATESLILAIQLSSPN